MLIYEVNLDVDEDINYKVAGWLSGHIEKMLSFKGFKVANWFFRKPEDENNAVSKKILWTIQYVIQDRASLDLYLNEHAQEMRQEGVHHFGEKIGTSHRILYLLNIIGSPEELETKTQGT